MTTVQIVGIAVAAAVVLLLAIALLVTRSRTSIPKEPPEQADASFLRDAPQDTLEGLGRAEQAVEDITLDPDEIRGLADRVPTPAPSAAVTAAAGLRQEPDPLAPDDDGREAGEVAPGEAGGTSETTPAEGVGPGEAPAAGPATPETSRKVPLSDIIVTTSSKVIDLDDPEVRRMLSDLAKFEIDQATRYREQGQDIDAVLQLTEAEKISKALGMQESAAAIRKMMKDLTRQM